MGNERLVTSQGGTYDDDRTNRREAARQGTLLKQAEEVEREGKREGKENLYAAMQAGHWGNTAG